MEFLCEFCSLPMSVNELMTCPDCGVEGCEDCVGYGGGPYRHVCKPAEKGGDGAD